MNDNFNSYDDYNIENQNRNDESEFIHVFEPSEAENTDELTPDKSIETFEIKPLPIVDETPSDSYYYDNFYHNQKEQILNTKYVPKKKKKYMSVSAAVIGFLLTGVISVTGGAIMSNLGIFEGVFGVQTQRPSYFSVEQNINDSKNTVGGTNANVDKINGMPLSTPEIVDKVGPAVVGIVNKTTFGNAYGYYGFFGSNLDKEIEQGSGSGVVISADGYIVTNNHVVEKATKINVILNTGEEYEAVVVGKDASTDLAIIKINATGLVYAQMGTSSTLRVGDTAIAIGNPLGQEFAGTTTQGIISGLNRSVTIDNKTMNLIQTDAAINPGNSGGALVNEYGYLIGINTAKISSETLEGLGFAIPIDEAKPIIEELVKNGYVTGRPVIGIAGRAVTKEDARAYNLKVGVYVSSITPNGPAHMSGVNVGDIIVECEGEPIETVDDINEIKNKKTPGEQISIKVYRRGEYKDIIIILGEESPVQ